MFLLYDSQRETLNIYFIILLYNHASSNTKGMTILGFTIAAIWSPLFVKLWQRRSNELVALWGMEKFHVR